MERLVAELRERASGRRIEIDVLTGGEIALAEVDRLEASELRRFGLGGNPRCLLVEFPYYGWPLALENTVSRLGRGGITAVIAHPERSAEVQSAPERLRPSVEAGALVQLTAASVDGRLGRASAAAARALLDRGLAHLVASDAHAPELRTAGLGAAARAVGDAALARWLADLVPAALVAGAPVPSRPEVGHAAGRRRFGLFRR